MATTRAVVRDAGTMVRRINQRLRTAAPAVATMLRHARARLRQMQPLVGRVLAQTSNLSEKPNAEFLNALHKALAATP